MQKQITNLTESTLTDLLESLYGLFLFACVQAHVCENSADGTSIYF